jgi:hypothetical protein
MMRIKQHIINTHYTGFEPKTVPAFYGLAIKISVGTFLYNYRYVRYIHLKRASQI